MTVLDFEPLLSAVTSHASALGCFDLVMGHEPKSPPGTGVSFAAWPEGIRANPDRSGLASVSIVVDLNARLYRNADAEPAGGVDPALINALQLVLNAYVGDFTLGGLIAGIDILGQAGKALDAKAGYLKTPDGADYRIYDITIPLLVDDVWEQAA